jgi:uncharacterized protein with FMN-binding domain
MKKQSQTNLFETGSQVAKKVVVSAVIIGVFIVYSLLHNRSGVSALSPVTSIGSTPNTSTPSGSAAATATSSGDTSGNSTGLYKDGTYTGGVADAQWGYVQVQVVIQNSRMADVKFLQYPNDRNRSVEINNYADAQLIQEALQAQSTQVDIVTGATDSSEAFIQSLADALTQAQA